MNGKFLFVGDIHQTHISPSIRTETYAEDIFAKLEATVEIAKREEVNGVIWMGDVHHNPHPFKVSHEITKRISQLAKSYEVPLWVLVGNHDILNGVLEEAWTRQPIALLDEVENVTLLGWDRTEIHPNVSVHPIPGVPHLEIDYYKIKGRKTHYDIILAHQSIARPGSEPPFSHVKAEEVAAISGANYVAYGHLHGNDGHYKIGDTTFANYGSICRGSIDKSDLTKIPTVYTLELKDGIETITPFVLPYKPAEEVFRLEQHVEKKEAKLEFSKYVKSLMDISVEKFSVDGVVSHLTNRADVERHVADKAISCIREVV